MLIRDKLNIKLVLMDRGWVQHFVIEANLLHKRLMLKGKALVAVTLCLGSGSGEHIAA